MRCSQCFNEEYLHTVASLSFLCKALNLFFRCRIACVYRNDGDRCGANRMVHNDYNVFVYEYSNNYSIRYYNWYET